MTYNKEIMPFQAISAIVSSYESALKDIESGFNSLARAKETLKNALGGYNHDILSGFSGATLHDLDLEYPQNCLQRSKSQLTRNTWNYILKQTEILTIISSKKKRQLQEQMESGDMPEITEQNIHDTLVSLRMNMKDLATETIAEAFEFLRPRRETHKTNSKYEVGRKVILTSFVDSSYGWMRMNYYRHEDLQKIDNAFHLLDGKGPAKYPDNLHTVVEEAMKGKQPGCDTPYFKCKWFKAGTFHVEFKRPDLLREFNRIGGGNRLRDAG